MEPDKATIRPPGLIVTVLASVTDQLKVTLSPSSMVLSSAVKELIIGAEGVVALQEDKKNNIAMIIKNLK